MLLQDILKAKGSVVYSIGPDETVGNAVRELVLRRVGALLVCQKDEKGFDRPLGILSERDLLLAHAEEHDPGGNTAAGKCPLMSRKVAELMTTDVIVVAPGDTVEQTMGLMTTKRIRHLPVVSEGRVVGIVSIGDIVKAQLDSLAVENRFMKDYIRG
jgi:CBS domain-containing protein